MWFALSFNAFSVNYRLTHKLPLFMKHKLQQYPYGPFSTTHTQQFFFLSLLSQGRNWDKQTRQNHCWSEATSKTRLATELCFKYVFGKPEAKLFQVFLEAKRGNCALVLDSQATPVPSTLPAENNPHSCKCSWKL